MPGAPSAAHTKAESSARRTATPDLGRYDPIKLPKLFRTYLRYGSKVCSPPAIDREFGTIDFLVLLDTHELSERSRRIFFAD